MNKIKLLAVSLITVALAACGGSDNDNEPNSTKGDTFVRILHASADAPKVDVLVDDKAVLTGVAYQQGSGYLELSEGQHTLSLRVSGTETIALKKSVTLNKGSYYSVIAQNNVASLELAILDDTERRANKTNDVTVVHAAPDAGNVDIYVTAPDAALESATLSDVAFKKNASLPNISAGDYQVRITGKGSKDAVYDSGSLSIDKDVTAIAIKSKMGASPVSLLIWADSVPAVVLDNTAEVRIVHAVDSVAVDVFAGGNKIKSNFNFKDKTDGYLKVKAGTLDVKIAPKDQGIDNALANLSASPNLERGNSYTVIAAGDSGDVTKAKLIVLVDTRSNDSDKAKVRLVHASSASAADPVDIFVYTRGSTQPVSPTFADVKLGQNTGYTDLPAASYTIDIAADNTTNPAVPDISAVAVEKGSVKTAIAVGNGSGLSAILLNDKRSN